MMAEIMSNFALESAHLTLEFEKSKQAAQILYEEEKARILQVNLLLQQYANEEAEQELEQQDDKLKEAEDLAEDLQLRLDYVQTQYEQAQSELRACMRDIDEYQTQMKAFDTIQSTATKHLSEKLALERQLNILQPEVDHLRSQVEARDNILADKLSLQRELAAAQVELDNEKRTIQRLKQETSTGHDALRTELEEIRAELALKQAKIERLEKKNNKQADEQIVAELETIQEELEAARIALKEKQAKITKLEKQISKRANENEKSIDDLDTTKQHLETANKRADEAEQQLQLLKSEKNASGDTDAQLQVIKKELAKERKAAQASQRDQLQKHTQWEREKEELTSKLDAFREKLRTTKSRLCEAEEKLEQQEQAKYIQSAAATKARMNRAPSVEPTQAPQPANIRKRNVARFDPDMTIGTPGHVAKRARLTASSVGDKTSFSLTPYLYKTLTILSEESPGQKIDETINEIIEEAEKEKETQPTKKKEKATALTVENVPKPTKAVKVTEKAKNSKEMTEQDQEAESAQLPELTVDTSDAVSKPKKKMVNMRKNIFDDEEPSDIKKTGSTARGLGKVNLGLNKVKAKKSVAVFSPLKKDRKMTSTLGAA